jgi:hypothetical protein
MRVARPASHQPVGPFIARLGIAFVELVVAASVVAGSIVVGHELKEWREWYGDPATHRPWAPTPRPVPTAQAEAR